jgi:hypothetical protein
VNGYEYEAAMKVAEHLGLVYMQGVGVYDSEGNLVYVEDATDVMSEEDEARRRAWRVQNMVAPSALTRRSIRYASQLRWRSPEPDLLRFVFWWNGMLMQAGHEAQSFEEWKTTTNGGGT